MKLDFIELAGFRGFRDKIRIELTKGFTILSGHNGTGKSTVLDAIDFALTGTINKFNVKEAKGGGLDEHIWWVGSGKADAHYVSVGFVDDTDERFVVSRSRENGCTMEPSEIISQLCNPRSAQTASVATLLQTTLIRDEFIAAFSLDLPEQMRFTLVRDAIGSMVGPDYSDRTEAILNAAVGARNRQNERIKEVQSELGRALGSLTDARSLAERSADLADALKIIESLPVSLPPTLAERIQVIQRLIAERRLALGQMETMRAQLKDLSNEVAFFSSPNAQEELGTLRAARDKAIKEKALADERLDLAVKADVAEREGDQFAAHISALLEHGEAIGLLSGHCPLCDAARTQPEFAMAIASARTRLASACAAFGLSVRNFGVQPNVSITIG
jgi:energy-coupling factor transporter ATP-binding protein EcfA2